MCDEELQFSVQNSLVDDEASLSMSQVNDAYIAILKKHRVTIKDTKNYER